MSTLGVTSAPGLDDGTSTNGTLQTGTGHVQPNAIVSKWEHLNLHPDLLRSILKYGLGPPNKIQQRACLSSCAAATSSHRLPQPRNASRRT